MTSNTSGTVGLNLDPSSKFVQYSEICKYPQILSVSWLLQVMKKSSLSLLLLIAIASWFYSPGLFDNKILVHGDNLHHAMPLLDLHKKMFTEGATPIWSNLIYGGHPLYAESQGGFSNPLNIISAI